MEIKYPNYQHTLLKLVSAIRKHYQENVNEEDYDHYIYDLLINKKHISIILLDGFGYNIYLKYPKENTFLSKFFYQVTNTVFPPTTVAATNAIITGKLPNETALLGWCQYFEDEDDIITIFTNKSNYYPERLVKIKVSDYLPVKPFYENYPNNSNFYPAFRPNGSKTFDELLTKTINHMKNNLYESSFSYSYWDNPDYLMHEYGIDDNKISNCLQEINNSFSNHYEELTKDDCIFVIADHGHINVKPIYLEDYPLILNTLERLPSIESRCASFKVKENEKAIFYQLAKTYFSPYFLIYTKQEAIDKLLFGTGINHPDLSKYLDDYILIAVDEYFFCDKRSSFLMKGQHAGMTKAEMEVPIFIITKE